jgi:subtilisin-like proprotein convertase family protein
VNAYIVDTGIRRTHTNFGGRAFAGFDAFNDGQNSNDCNGHGTHVAGTVGSTTYGLAKGARLYAVRVLNCQGSGTNEGVIAGVEWVTSNHVKPAVANMSLGGGASQALDDAVRASIAAGVTYALAAGNENANACNGSPSRVAEAITVGSTTNTDARSSFSNWGTCVDIFAPGTNITSLWMNSDAATSTISGTSMASPHVAGAAVLYLAANPTANPQAVRDALVNASTANKVTNPGTGSPNRLLYTGFIGGGGGTNTPPSTSITAPASGSTVSGTVTVTANASDADGTITKVAFTLPGGGTVEDTSAPYSASWNTVAAGNGSRTVTATATDDDGATTTASVTVTVSNGGGGGCIDGEFAASGLPVSIPDNNATGVTPTLAVTGNGTVSTLAISLGITHTYRGDLKVTLTGPDGTAVVVHNRTGGSADNLVLSSTAVTGFAGRPAAGTWRLLVQDLAGADVGSVNSWSLRITASCDGGGGTGWSASASPNLATVDNGQVCHTINVTGTGNAADVKLDLGGQHAWRSILRGTLAHGGVTRDAFPTGTFASNAGAYSLTARPVAGFTGDASGAWTLCVVDTDAYGDSGVLSSWSVHD